MQFEKHRCFDLLIASNETIEVEAGRQILKRSTLHEWPLSCVELITYTDQSKHICKSISGPVIEPAFYHTANSALLPSCRPIHGDSKHAIMLIEFLKGKRADEAGYVSAQAFASAEKLTSQIRGLATNVPVFMDIGPEGSWCAIYSEMCRNLRELVEQQGFTHVRKSSIDYVQSYCESSQLHAALRDDVGLIHGDLTAQNVFLEQDTFRIIDWQFPRRGPRTIDVSIFLDSLGFDPADFVDVNYVALMLLIRIEWLTQCAVKWFPPGRHHYDIQISDMLRKLEELLGCTFSG